MEKNKKYTKEPCYSGFRIGCVDPKDPTSWIGMFQVIYRNGTRKFIDQNKNGNVNGPKIRFNYK